jgi:hypothetical protein
MRLPVCLWQLNRQAGVLLVVTFLLSFSGLVNASLRLPAGRQGNSPH